MIELMEAAVAVEVPSGSAGFTCSDDLVITRLDEAGRAEQAGVELGMRVCEFMGEALPAERTWAELKKVARVTPKPWRFGFGFPPPAEPAPAGESLEEGGAAPAPPAVAPEERGRVRRLFRAARSGDEAALRRVIDEGVDVNVATRDGWTALLQASWYGHDACVSALRSAGATIQSAAAETAGTAPYLEARRMVFSERKLQAAGEALPEGVEGLEEVAQRALWGPIGGTPATAE